MISKTELLPVRDLHAAQRYLESLLDSDDPLSLAKSKKSRRASLGFGAAR